MENTEVPQIAEPSTGLPFFTLALIISCIVLASLFAYRRFRKSRESGCGSVEPEQECEGDQCQME